MLSRTSISYSQYILKQMNNFSSTNKSTNNSLQIQRPTQQNLTYEHDSKYQLKSIYFNFFEWLEVFSRSATIIITMTYKLEVSFWNWKKQNNQGLCDFKEISRKEEKKFPVQGPGIIYRNLVDYNLIFIPIKKVSESGQLKQHQPLFSIREQDSSYKIIDLKNSLQPLSIKVPQIQQNLPKNLQINKGSILKLGKATLEIIKVKPDILQSTCTLYKKPSKSLIEETKKITFSHYNFLPDIEIHEQQTRKQSTENQDIYEEKEIIEKESYQFSLYPENPSCKVCLSRTLQKDNSLISLCKCNGSTRFIHEQCLKNWIEHKSHLASFDRNGQKAIYMASMQGFQCQICKQPYSMDQIFELLFQENQQKFQDYVALTLKCQQTRLLYIVNLAQIPQIRIGRDLDNDICISNQLTVSRNHCIIRKKNNNLYLIDLNSKFGTLIKKPSLLVTSQVLKLQKGRTYLQISKKKDAKNIGFFSNFALCCPQS